MAEESVHVKQGKSSFAAVALPVVGVEVEVFMRALFSSFFSSESGLGQIFFYLILLAFTILYSTVSLLAPILQPPCEIQMNEDVLNRAHARALWQGLEGGLEKAPNPDYHPDPCRWERYAVLLWMNKWECDMTRRIIISIIMGSIIGFERRRADRPAGIRTMAMVCLGSCVFTLGSMYAFLDGTMGWDASRVSAAIPSGVGFLGAASIWKGTKSSGSGADASTVPEVHGLTTATTVWLAAAVGILCGGALYVPALLSTFLGVVYLRFAPRLRSDQEEPVTEAAPGDGLESGSEKGELREPLAPNKMPGAGSKCASSASQIALPSIPVQPVALTKVPSAKRPSASILP